MNSSPRRVSLWNVVLLQVALVLPFAAVFWLGWGGGLQKQPVWSVSALGFSPDDEVVVVGSSGTTSNTTMDGSFWIALDADGLPAGHGRLPDSLRSAIAAAPDTEGVLLGGASRRHRPGVVRITPGTGTISETVSVRTGEGLVWALARSDDGDLIIAGARGGAPFVERQSADGEARWWASLPRVLIGGVAPHGSGAIAVVSLPDGQVGLVPIDDQGAVGAPRALGAGKATAIGVGPRGSLAVGTDGADSVVALVDGTVSEATVSTLSGVAVSAVSALSDGWLLAGSSNGDAAVVWLGPNGAETWRATHGGPGEDAFSAIGVHPTLGIIAAGTREDETGPDGWVVALDERGGVRWRRTLRGLL